MRQIRSLLLIGLAAGALTACGEKDKDPAPGQRAVGGKILERSIGDDMLPYDTVRSQPPLAKPEKIDGAAGDGNSGSAKPGAASDLPAEAAEVVEPADDQETPTPDAE